MYIDYSIARMGEGGPLQYCKRRTYQDSQLRALRFSLVKPAKVVSNEMEIITARAVHHHHPSVVGLLRELAGTPSATPLAGVHHLQLPWYVVLSCCGCGCGLVLILPT